MEEYLTAPLCCEDHIDPQHEEQIRARLPGDAEAADLAAVFTHLSDSTRVKLLSMLAASDLCVCEMSDLLGMSQPAVSHHLRILRQCDVVGFRKMGQRTVYYLNENEIGDTIRRLLQVAIQGKGQHHA